MCPDRKGGLKMKCLFHMAAMIALGAITACGHAQPVQYGRPSSPLSWRVLTAEEPIRESEFSLSRNILGSVPEHPTSLVLADFKDERPYGEKEQRRVLLARFDSVVVRAANEGSPTVIALNVACDAETKELVCAFTDSSPRWAVSTLPPQDIMTGFTRSGGWRVSPARYDSLRSSLTDILAAVWKDWGGLDLSTAGQVIIRPRFVTSRFPAREVEGTLVPLYPPSNVWIVEVLGTPIMARAIAGEECWLTTLIAQLRDGDLDKGLGTALQP